jgi:hypothetical protein
MYVCVGFRLEYLGFGIEGANLHTGNLLKGNLNVVDLGKKIVSIWMEELELKMESESDTSMQIWCMPPSLFLARKLLMGLVAPKGCSSFYI